MSDFYQSRARVEYTTAGGECHLLLTPGQLMLQAEPVREWEVSNISADLIGADWGYETACGNARLVLSWEALICRPTVAELERTLRRLELALNLHRVGSLCMGEALAEGVPTLCTQWQAVLATCKVRRLALEEAPAGAPAELWRGKPAGSVTQGAWGAVALSFRLTHPQEV